MNTPEQNQNRPSTSTNSSESASGSQLNVTGDGASSKITVNVGMPGNMKKVTLEGSRPTIQDALNAAGFNAQGREVRMSGEKVGLNDPVYDGRTIFLLQAVKGN